MPQSITASRSSPPGLGCSKCAFPPEELLAFIRAPIIDDCLSRSSFQRVTPFNPTTGFGSGLKGSRWPPRCLAASPWATIVAIIAQHSDSKLKMPLTQIQSKYFVGACLCWE